MLLPFAHINRETESVSAAFEMMMLAPWVIAMRVPNVIYEMATPWHGQGGRRGGESEKAIVEKTAALVESYGVVQAEMMSSWSNIVTSTMLGEMPDMSKMARSLQDISDAGLQPMAKRVRANYARLKKRAA